MVVDAVRARMIVASAWAAAGEVDRASAELKSVQSTFESFGAKALARQAMAERRRLAARTSRRRFTAPAEGLAALTRRERQVATLVSEGLTNRAIAQQLFVTEKTVEMHLANIFAKLGVSSRASVASAVTRSVGA
jgi:DNA-binding NarL/FixJ family response regulator